MEKRFIKIDEAFCFTIMHAFYTGDRKEINCIGYSSQEINWNGMYYNHNCLPVRCFIADIFGFLLLKQTTLHVFVLFLFSCIIIKSSLQLLYFEHMVKSQCPGFLKMSTIPVGCVVVVGLVHMILIKLI